MRDDLRKFHLSFSYHPAGAPERTCKANEVVFADTLENAALSLMRDRGIFEILITYRHSYSLADCLPHKEEINQTFRRVALVGPADSLPPRRRR